MSNLSFDKKRFEGENIIAYPDDIYLVFGEDGQGEFIIPYIEVYEIKHGLRVAREDGKVDLFCPNMNVLNHDKNQWSRVDDTMIECSECGAKMDISKAEGRAKLEEK